MNDPFATPVKREIGLSPSPPFRSLRGRLLGPMIGTALIAAVSVAIGSYWWGSQWANEEMHARYLGIKQALTDSSFPLSASVLESLADLTQTELITLNEGGEIQHRTLDVTDAELKQSRVTVSGTRYLVLQFQTAGGSARADQVARVAVLFNEDRLDAAGHRAALLPLVTGVSTILALTSVTFLLTSRLIFRIGKLKRRVETVAAGDFQSTVSDHVADEVGQLGVAVDDMANQLDQLWKQINRQQGEKLLHQIAGGMAHQLRNSLTGARMGVELHDALCRGTDDEGLRVAIRQIELSEDYVRRLLLVASGRQDKESPLDAKACLGDIQTCLDPVAEHLRIDLQWRIDDSISERWVSDGPTFSAAVTNLVHNAMQAGNQVQVVAQCNDVDHIRVQVRDNGHGVDQAIQDDLFEPFVTTKPEGMGLGLSVVQRAAERLGGTVRWYQSEGWTVFDFVATVSNAPVT